ncbi:MAG: hypothetical protein COA84_12810 [Robiginitomaculum sp.]|nr:MAG: hypothetical protein COA84_12810 [Robiginitomaculum sp.]
MVSQNTGAIRFVQIAGLILPSLLAIIAVSLAMGAQKARLEVVEAVMPANAETRERVIVLEQQLQQVIATGERIERNGDRIEKKLDRLIERGK